MAYDHATDAETTPPPRRRRRRVTSSAKFWVAFVIVVLGGVAAVAALVGSRDSEPRLGERVESGGGGDGAAGGDGESTTTAPPFAGFREYEVTDGVNIRSGPGTTYAVVGTVETGHKVFVVCWAEGETINGPSGPTNKWVKVLSGPTIGYITNQYVDTRADINDPQIIALCESL